MLAFLTAKLLATRTGASETGFDPLAQEITFAQEIAFELSDPGQHVGHHAPVRCVEFQGLPLIATTETFQPATWSNVVSKSGVERPHRDSSVTRMALI